MFVYIVKEKREVKKLDMGHEKQKNKTKTKSMKEIEKVSGFRVKVCVLDRERNKKWYFDILLESQRGRH